MIRINNLQEISLDEVLRSWAKRESRKPECPCASVEDLDVPDLKEILSETYCEPVGNALGGSPNWISFDVDGDEIGKFDAFRGENWSQISGDGTISGVVDGLQSEDLAKESI